MGEDLAAVHFIALGKKRWEIKAVMLAPSYIWEFSIHTRRMWSIVTSLSSSFSSPYLANPIIWQTELHPCKKSLYGAILPFWIFGCFQIRFKSTRKAVSSSRHLSHGCSCLPSTCEIEIHDINKLKQGWNLLTTLVIISLISRLFLCDYRNRYAMSRIQAHNSIFICLDINEEDQWRNGFS